jgi:hypothetical protein
MNTKYTHRLHYTVAKGGGKPREESFEIAVHPDWTPEKEGRKTIGLMNDVSDETVYKFVRVEPL